MQLLYYLFFFFRKANILFYIFEGNADVQASLNQLRERWRALRQEIRGERQRLERLLQLWREYQTGMDDMVDWLMSILSLMRNEDICDDSLDVVEGQLEHLRVRAPHTNSPHRSPYISPCTCWEKLSKHQCNL